MPGQEAGLTPLYVAKEGEALTAHPAVGERKASAQVEKRSFGDFIKIKDRTVHARTAS